MNDSQALRGIRMSKSLIGALDEVSHKWRRLAERRRDYFVDLFRSGRWKQYYTEVQFLRLLQEADCLTERWSNIAPPGTEHALSDALDTAPVAATPESPREGSRRDAA